jgi:hypothetical protein
VRRISSCGESRRAQILSGWSQESVTETISGALELRLHSTEETTERLPWGLGCKPQQVWTGFKKRTSCDRAETLRHTGPPNSGSLYESMQSCWALVAMRPFTRLDEWRAQTRPPPRPWSALQHVDRFSSSALGVAVSKHRGQGSARSNALAGQKAEWPRHPGVLRPLGN